MTVYFQMPLHSANAMAWLPIVGPNKTTLDLNVALACAGPFMDMGECVRANFILGVLNRGLTPEERVVCLQWAAGLTPGSYAFSAADGAQRIKYVLNDAAGFLGQSNLTEVFRKDLLAIANRVEGRYGVAFEPTEG